VNGIADERDRGVIGMTMRGMTRYVVEFRAMVKVESRGSCREKGRWTGSGLAVKKGCGSTTGRGKKNTGAPTSDVYHLTI